jgi:hypothetical protein
MLQLAILLEVQLLWLKLHLRRAEKLLPVTAEGSVKVKLIHKLSYGNPAGTILYITVMLG